MSGPATRLMFAWMLVDLFALVVYTWLISILHGAIWLYGLVAFWAILGAIDMTRFHKAWRKEHGRSD